MSICIIGWTDLRWKDLIDELSVVISPVADGGSNVPTLFERGSIMDEIQPMAFKLKNVEKLPGSDVWLDYINASFE